MNGKKKYQIDSANQRRKKKKTQDSLSISIFPFWDSRLYYYILDDKEQRNLYLIYFSAATAFSSSFLSRLCKSTQLTNWFHQIRVRCCRYHLTGVRGGNSVFLSVRLTLSYLFPGPAQSLTPTLVFSTASCWTLSAPAGVEFATHVVHHLHYQPAPALPAP